MLQLAQSVNENNYRMQYNLHQRFFSRKFNKLAITIRESFLTEQKQETGHKGITVDRLKSDTLETIV